MIYRRLDWKKHRRRITPNTATLLFSVILLNGELMTVHLCEDCLILLEKQFIFACWATIQIVAELHVSLILLESDFIFICFLLSFFDFA